VTVSRENYIAVGMAVLADQGQLGLKSAEVCRRLTVTSGSFDHCFDSWRHYKRELVEHWRTEATTKHLAVAAIPATNRRPSLPIRPGSRQFSENSSACENNAVAPIGPAY